MYIEELSQCLGYLNADEDVHTYFIYMQSTCADKNGAHRIISDLESKKGLPITGDSPFYFVFLSYAYHSISGWSKAIHFGGRAINLFRWSEDGYNESICNWFVSLLCCLHEDFDTAQSYIESAISIINSLEDSIRNSGIYENSSGSYQYSNLVTLMNNTYDTLKRWVVHNIAIKQNRPIIKREMFSSILKELSIPEGLDYIGDWINKLVAPEFSSFLDNRGFIDSLFNRAESASDNRTESSLLNMLIGHRYNLGYYSTNGQDQAELAEERIRFAIDELVDDHENMNHLLANGYLSLFYYNRNWQGTGRAHLEDAFWCINQAQNIYKKGNLASDRLQKLQSAIRNWEFKYANEIIDAHQSYIRKPRESQPINQEPSLDSKQTNSRVDPRKNRSFFGSIPTLLSRKKQKHGPDSTGMRKNQSAVSLLSLKEDVKKAPPTEGEPSELPRDKNVSQPRSDNSDVRLIVIPVDMNALDSTNIIDSVANREIIDKLAKYDEEYSKLTKQPQENHQGIPKASRHIIIPSFPLYGSATAGPSGSADLPSADGSLPYLVPEIDETLVVKIYNRVYSIHLLPGLQEIQAGSGSYDWFFVEGDSMNDAKPITIDNHNFILFRRKDRSQKSYDGEIVLVSVRDGNVDPTRLLVKRFVIMKPSQQPGLDVTTPFLLSESHPKRFGAIEFTDDYQIEGEVLAVAKPI